MFEHVLSEPVQLQQFQQIYKMENIDQQLNTFHGASSSSGEFSLSLPRAITYMNSSEEALDQDQEQTNRPAQVPQVPLLSLYQPFLRQNIQAPLQFPLQISDGSLSSITSRESEGLVSIPVLVGPSPSSVRADTQYLQRENKKLRFYFNHIVVQYNSLAQMFGNHEENHRLQQREACLNARLMSMQQQLQEEKKQQKQEEQEMEKKLAKKALQLEKKEDELERLRLELQKCAQILIDREQELDQMKLETEEELERREEKLKQKNDLLLYHQEQIRVEKARLQLKEADLERLKDSLRDCAEDLMQTEEHLKQEKLETEEQLRRMEEELYHEKEILIKKQKKLQCYSEELHEFRDKLKAKYESMEKERLREEGELRKNIQIHEENKQKLFRRAVELRTAVESLAMCQKTLIEEREQLSQGLHEKEEQLRRKEHQLKVENDLLLNNQEQVRKETLHLQQKEDDLEKLREHLQEYEQAILDDQIKVNQVMLEMHMALKDKQTYLCHQQQKFQSDKMELQVFEQRLHDLKDELIDQYETMKQERRGEEARQQVDGELKPQQKTINLRTTSLNKCEEKLQEERTHLDQELGPHEEKLQSEQMERQILSRLCELRDELDSKYERMEHLRLKKEEELQQKADHLERLRQKYLNQDALEVDEEVSERKEKGSDQKRKKRKMLASFKPMSFRRLFRRVSKRKKVEEDEEKSEAGSSCSAITDSMSENRGFRSRLPWKNW